MNFYYHPLPCKTKLRFKYKYKTLLVTNLRFILDFMFSKNLPVSSILKPLFVAVSSPSLPFLLSASPSLSESCGVLLCLLWQVLLAPLLTLRSRPCSCHIYMWWPWSRTLSFNPLYTLLWNSSSLNTALQFTNTSSRLPGPLAQKSGHCLILQTCYVLLTWTSQPN